MIDVHYWPTPNGHKVTMLLEETGTPYALKPVNIGKGEQFEPDFLKIAPNNRMPAIVDHAPADGGAPVSLFESGAILLYLADKLGQFIPADLRGRAATLEWLFWQMGGFGPMLGQNHHFNFYATEKLPYAIERYVNETKRLYGVLDRRLEGRAWIVGEEYTIADMACYPWAVQNDRQSIVLADYPNVQRWFEAVAARPATVRAYAREWEVRPKQPTAMSDQEKQVLFGTATPGIASQTTA